MATLREWLNRLWGTLGPGRNDRDLEQELRLHLELAAADAQSKDSESGRAARRTRVDLGGVAQAMEALRDQRGLPWLSDLALDVRYGCRMLVKQPGFTAVAVLSLALGIGANTAIFSLIDVLMLRTLPVREPERLVELLTNYPGEPRVHGHSWKVYEHLRDENHVFSDFIGVSPSRFQVSGDGLETETVDGEYVVGTFFPALGVRPVLGRLIGPADDRPGAADTAAAVVSWSYWQSRFNADPLILGKRIVVDRVPATVVGVAPREFFGLLVGSRPDVWVPVAMEPLIQRPSRLADGTFGVGVMARLKPGVSIEQARAEMRVLNKWRVEQMSAQMHNDPQWLKAQLVVEAAGTGFSLLRNHLAKPLLALMSLVALLLLVACTNIASLLLARGAARQREMAVRVSLGAGRMRLVRQVLTESVLLSAAGGLLGVVLAYFGADALVRIMASGRAFVGLPQRVQIPVTLDSRVLLFTAAVALATGVLFGLAPAWNACASTPASSLLESGRGGETRSRRLFGKSLVVAQVALSVVLLSAAGLFIGHLSNLRNLDLGFRSDSVLLVSLNAQGSGYNRYQLTHLYRDLLPRLEALPGVRSVALSGVTPIEGGAAASFADVEGFQEKPDDRRYLNLNWVGPKYFETLATPLIAGRDFEFQDEGRPRVAIVNQVMARHYFPDTNPLGKHITFDGDKMPYEIVGVVGDAKYRDLRQSAPRTVYLNTFQEGRISSQLSLRTTVAPASVVSDVRQTVRDMLTTVQIAKVTTLTEQVDASIVPERVTAALSGLFGALGAVLAAIGLYGLLAYTVARRTNEIGIRMALGATSRDVTKMVLKGAFGLVCTGLIVGAPLAVSIKRFAEYMVGNLQVDTAFPIAVAATAMIALALLAAYVPARRAARVNPVESLRHE